MKRFLVFVVIGTLLIGFASGFAFSPEQPSSNLTNPTSKKSPSVLADDDFPPIDNMHHFMEYISQPSYRELKKAFAGDPPADRRAWKPIKSHALILAETSALVANRTPKDATEEDKKAWRQMSIDVYNSGKALYQSAGDFEAAKKNYAAMIDNCNKCHSKFENGKHQLEK